MVVINQNNPDAHESRSLIGANRNSQYGTTENGQPSTLDSNSTIGTAGYSTAEDDCFLIAGNTNDLSSKSYRTANEDEAIPNPTEAQVEDQNSSKSVIVGVILVVVYAICLSAATQTGKELYTTSNFTGASLVAWSSRSLLLIFYPIIVISLLFSGQSYDEIYMRASKFYKQKGSSLRITIIKIIPLTCLSLGIAYFYLISLSFLSSTNVSAIYSFSAAIVYVMSLIFLKEPFLFLRFLAVVISLAGVVLITIAKEDGSFIVSGVFLALAAAFCGASFRVVTKVIIGSASVIETTFLLTIMGTQSLCIFWIPILILHFTNVEVIVVPDFPWTWLMLTILLRTTFNLLVCIGIAYTHPIYISIGSLLTIPINAIIDSTVRHQNFQLLEIIGTILLIIAFIVFTIPLNIIISVSAKIRLSIRNLLCRPTL